VWLYFRFHLSHRDVEDLLAERGIRVSYEAVRLWCHTFGPVLAARLRRCRRRAAGKWHLDEVQRKIKGKRHWLWRAVDSDGLVLDILVQDRRDQGAAERFLREFPVQYPSVFDGDGAQARAVGAGTSWPTTIFYDAAGNVRLVRLGGYATATALDADIRAYALDVP